MGLFKIIGLFSGLPIRPTTGRERSRMYQRQANDILEDILEERPRSPQNTSLADQLKRSATKESSKVSSRLSIAEQLAVLAELRERGALTEQEFQTLKTRLISGNKLFRFLTKGGEYRPGSS